MKDEYFDAGSAIEGIIDFKGCNKVPVWSYL